MLRFIWMNTWPANINDINGQEEENVFSFVIKETEGERPYAQVSIQNPYCVTAAYDFAKIGVLVEQRSAGQDILFIGYMHIVEKNQANETVVISLIGGQERVTLEEKVLSPDPLGSLFHEDHDPSTFHLKRRGKLPYWDRRTGALTETDPLKGEKSYDVTPFLIKESFIIEKPSPLPRVIRIKLTTEWMQRYLGETDLSYTLRTLFPGGLINTLTGDALKVRWWKAGKRLGRSRYWVDYTHLKEISPPYTGILNLYPSVGINYQLSSHDPLNTTQRDSTVMIKRRWFRAQVILGWEYHQKRHEEVNLKFDNPCGSDNLPAWDIFFPLRRIDHCSQDPWQKARGRFFTTDFGKEVIQAALDLAYFYLKIKNRQQIVKVTVPWEQGILLTVNTEVTLKDERLPRHQARGKITSFKAYVDGETSNHWVELEISLIEESQMNNQLRDRIQSVSNYYLKERSLLQEGIDYPMSLSEADIVEQASLHFGPEQQIDFLREFSFPKHHHLQNLLKSIHTDINLILKDISARPLLKRQYDLQLKE